MYITIFFFFTLTLMCIYTQDFPEFYEEKTPEANNLCGTRTHNLCIARADVLPLAHRASPMAR